MAFLVHATVSLWSADSLVRVYHKFHPDERADKAVCAPSRIGRGRLRWLVIGFVALTSSLQAQVFREYDLKALFLYNFAQFVDWPAEAFPTAETPLVLGVIGLDRFGKSLDDLTRTEATQRRKLTIARYRRVAEIQNSHILFIDRSQASNLEQILEKVRGKPVLTVSDIDGFARRGGMIQFITEEKKIRLRVNVPATKRAGLTVSSKLLKLAEIE
jgi:hypothetical protein